MNVRALGALLILLIIALVFGVGYQIGKQDEAPEVASGEIEEYATSTTPEVFSSTAVVATTTSPAPLGTVKPSGSTSIPKPTSSSSGTSGTTTTSGVAGSGVPVIAGCPVFPASNPWNQDISKLPVHPQSATYMSAIGLSRNLHPDFGQIYGIPYNVVGASQPKVPITFTAYGDESDAGPYPVPPDAKREGGGDRHVLVLETGSCTLYELFAAEKDPNSSGWLAESGAIWHLNSNALRPEGWTSADAAGLPILPGLVRYDEAAANAIRHAIRFTAPRTQKGYIHPATHHAGQNNTTYPPMGLRVRLKADYDITGLTGEARAIATALKTYGMMLADNGSSWYITGAMDSRWNDDNLNQLKKIPGTAFEAVYTGEIIR